MNTRSLIRSDKIIVRLCPSKLKCILYINYSLTVFYAKGTVVSGIMHPLSIVRDTPLVYSDV